MKRITTTEMEIAIANFFGIRKNLIVPNIRWGLDIHECDLLILRKSGYAVEVEIKISMADLKKDFEKRHGHLDWHNRIKEFYYAIPKHLYEKALPLIEENSARAGIISVDKHPILSTMDQNYTNRFGTIVKMEKKAKQIKCKPLTDEERYQVARLGAMRIWGLKKKMLKAYNGKQMKLL